MNGNVRRQIDRLIENFDGKVYLVQDMGDKAIVMIDPSPRGPFQGEGEPSDAWKRIEEPTLMLIDPSRCDYPRVVN